jgi:MFS family permease
MTFQEQRATLALGSIFACRMLGLFMILPVFSLYAEHLQGSTPQLMGLAIGIYGLTQALLQIPFGTLSDFWGRKPVILLGLILFALGSVIAALSSSILGVIIGRALQGSGAIGSTIIAFVADLTHEQNRTKAMGLIGLTIGFSFTLAMVLGPLLNAWVHVAGIFWLTALLALGAIIILYTLVPNAKTLVVHSDSEANPGQILSVLKNRDLIALNVGIFFLHAILTAMFVAIPRLLSFILNFPSREQWFIYLPILVLSLLLTVPAIILAEKKRLMKPILLLAIGSIILVELSLSYLQLSVLNLCLCLLLFFSAFNFLEASLPSLISKLAPLNNKGTAMGIYSSFQFFGIFCGGGLGGFLLGHFAISSVFIGCAIMAFCWLGLAMRMHNIPYHSTRIFKLTDAITSTALAKLKEQPGIAEVALNQAEGAVYVKIDSHLVSDEQLNNFFSGENNGQRYQ